MPHRLKINWPEWVEGLRDPVDGCLSAVVMEALHARDVAVRVGALSDRRCAGAVRAGDKTLDNIGRITGPLACKRAADALRKYVQAQSCGAR